MELIFEIAGGKYEPDGEVNYKYIDNAGSFEAALIKYNTVKGYPFSYLRMVFEDGLHKKCVTLLGEPTDEEIYAAGLEASITRLFDVVIGTKAVDVGSTKGQLDCIYNYVRATKKGK